MMESNFTSSPLSSTWTCSPLYIRQSKRDALSIAMYILGVVFLLLIRPSSFIFPEPPRKKKGRTPQTQQQMIDPRTRHTKTPKRKSKKHNTPPTKLQPNKKKAQKQSIKNKP